MKLITIIFFASILILSSCKNTGKDYEKNKSGPQSEITDIERTPEVIEEKETKSHAIDFSKTVVPFIEKVLKENQRRHELGTQNKEIRHLEIFEKKGLQEIIAYSDRRYPKRTEPTYYENFILFALRYDDIQSAKDAYNEIKKISEITREDYEKLGETEKQQIRKLETSTKPGGMICQKGKFVFSLVETCRETPIGGKWEEYENLFLSFITEPNEEIMILNANCGQMKYVEEKK